MSQEQVWGAHRIWVTQIRDEYSLNEGRRSPTGLALGSIWKQVNCSLTPGTTGPQVSYIFSNLLSGNVLINTNMCNALANPSTFCLTVGTDPKPQNWISNGGFLYVSDKSGEDTLPYSYPQYLIGGFLISLWAYQSNFWKAFSKR